MKKVLLLLCSLIMLTTSCATTDVISTWQGDQQEEKYTKIFVLGLVKEPVYRSLLERQLVNLLNDIGVDAHTTFDLFPNLDPFDKDAAAAVIKKRGGNAVLVIHLIDKEEETLYQRGYSMRVGGGGADGLNSFYDYVHVPDSAIDKHISLVESVIFDIKKEKRIWSTMTKTTETSIADSIYSYRKAINKPLKSSKLF